MHLCYHIAAVLTLHSYLLTAQEHSSCIPSSNCTACLQQGSQCAWCYKKDVKSILRCNTVANHRANGCNGHFLNPDSSVEAVEPDEVRNADAISDAVQISPQKLKVTLRPGRKASFPITFRIAENYPVDLYYIMDLSYSMKDDQEKLINLGESIAAELKIITSDVRLGFGAFVDKAVMPFAGMREISKQNPCFPAGQCAPMYGFKNLLSLTTNISIFGPKVEEAPISGNQDSPEGGFDALLQAMVCQRKIGWRKNVRKIILFASDVGSHIAGDGRSEIGWRSNSRKIILFSTDARSHIAADAKLAGILEPNDGHCHMRNNEYTYSKRQDYPSISQIAKIAKRTSTSIIFAVNQYSTEYEAISRLIPSSVVGELADDSSNIVALVSRKYDSLIKRVILRATDLEDSEVELKFWSNCGSADSEQTNVCEEARIGQRIEFEAEVRLKSCTQSHSRRFSIKPSDLIDSVEIELEVDCDCDCTDQEVQSSECSGNGTYSCGTCNCNEGYSGERCECDESTVQTAAACINPETEQVCSSNGECGSCGSCICACISGSDEPDCIRFSGKYCQCNNVACDNHDGVLCGGRGGCICKELSAVSYCDCYDGYSGKACECPDSKENCKANNGTGQICDGKGTCKCGQCECSDPCYTGATCEILAPECSRSCVSFKECVACKLNSALNQPCPEDCPNVEIVPELDSSEPRQCSYPTIENCDSFYTLSYNHGSSSWIVKALQKCDQEYLLELIIGMVVGVLLIGVIALIIWKVAVTVHDRREFAKFEKEALQAKWESTNNPIYKPATSTFQNPMYGGTRT